MKIVIILMLNLFIIGSLNAEECGSRFCQKNESGDTCTIKKDDYTCGKCADTEVLFLGILSAEVADKKCFCMHYPKHGECFSN